MLQSFAVKEPFLFFLRWLVDFRNPPCSVGASMIKARILIIKDLTHAAHTKYRKLKNATSLFVLSTHWRSTWAWYSLPTREIREIMILSNTSQPQVLYPTHWQVATSPHCPLHTISFHRLLSLINTNNQRANVVPSLFVVSHVRSITQWKCTRLPATAVHFLVTVG